MKIVPIFLTFILVLSITMTGCTLFSSSPSNDVAKKDVVGEPSQNQYLEEEETDLKKEDVIDISIEGDEDDGVKTKIDTGKSAKLPTDIPSFFPLLKGDLEAVIESEADGYTNYTLAFKNPTPTDMEDMAQKLDGVNGWIILSKSQMGDGWILTAHNETKDAMLTCSITDEDTGMMQISFKK
ncbi:MAG: hypothetical protein PHX86_08635 [Caldisericia bacterium]|nr:hypothetical protein [Caldisericia bacterium]